MTQRHPLVSILATHDPAIELLALLVAKDAEPGVDVEEWLRHLDELAAPLVERKLGKLPPIDSARALVRHVYGTCGFHGNTEDYYDPANSYLDQVIRRRTGIPITLAIVLIAIGRRAGIPVQGIGFPGHFLVRVGGPSGVFLDPLDGGRELDAQALEDLTERVLGPSARLDPRYLEPADAHTMTVRMLANLKIVHRRRGDHARAMLVCDRLLDLTALPEHRRDRGLHALALGSLEVALDDLETYLRERPQAEDATVVRNTLARVRATVGPSLS